MHDGRERAVENTDLIGGGSLTKIMYTCMQSRKLPVRTIKVNLSLLDIFGVDFSVKEIYSELNILDITSKD